MILGEWHVHGTLSSYRNITILTSNKITAFSIHSYVTANSEIKQEAEGALSHSPEKHVWIVHLHKIIKTMLSLLYYLNNLKKGWNKCDPRC